MRETPPYLRLVTLESEEKEVDDLKPKSLREWFFWRGVSIKDVLLLAFLIVFYIFSGAVLIFGIFNS